MHSFIFRCVIVSGKDVPTPQKNENIYRLFCDLMFQKFRISIGRGEIGQIHRIGNGKNIIVEFNNRGPNTNFQKILMGLGSNPQLQIRAEMKVTKSVKRAKFMAEIMKRNGDIAHFFVSF